MPPLRIFFLLFLAFSSFSAEAVDVGYQPFVVEDYGAEDGLGFGLDQSLIFVAAGVVSCQQCPRSGISRHHRCLTSRAVITVACIPSMLFQVGRLMI